MKELKCKNCGAPLVRSGWHGYKCEHCGAVYCEEEYRGEVQLLCVHDARAVPLCVEIEVPFTARDYMPSEDISKYTISELTHKLAEGLAAYMQLDAREDPCRMATIVRGTVRVIPPDHRF